jgi:hypothetical protein
VGQRQPDEITEHGKRRVLGLEPGFGYRLGDLIEGDHQDHDRDRDPGLSGRQRLPPHDKPPARMHCRDTDPDPGAVP